MYDVSRMDAAARLPLTVFHKLDADPRHWQIIALGGLFIAVTLFLPKGIMGAIDGYMAKRKAAKDSGPEAQPQEGD